MTPEQTTELLKALNQHNWFPVVCGIIWLLGTILQFLIVARFKSAIETKQHFSRVRYERELKVYEELWPKLCELKIAALSLRPVADWGLSEGQTEQSRKQKRSQRYWDAHGSFMLAVENSRPFYSREVLEQLQKLIKLCWGEAVDWGLFNSERLRHAKENREDYWEKAEKNADAINKQIDTICEVIRTRLNKFDNI